MVKTLKINKDRMKELAEGNYITATELIDLFMEKADISFRTAHKLVGKLIKKLISECIELKNIQPSLIQGILKEILNKNVDISNEEIENAVDPLKTIQKRISIGGPAKKEVLRMLEDRKDIIQNLSKKNLENKKKIKNSYEELQKKVQIIISK